MQAYRSLNSYKQWYIHRNQYNETCIGKKKINIWLIFVLGTARYEFEYDQILTLLSMHFSFAFFPVYLFYKPYNITICLYISICQFKESLWWGWKACSSLMEQVPTPAATEGRPSWMNRSPRFGPCIWHHHLLPKGTRSRTPEGWRWCRNWIQMGPLKLWKPCFFGRHRFGLDHLGSWWGNWMEKLVFE